MASVEREITSHHVFDMHVTTNTLHDRQAAPPSESWWGRLRIGREKARRGFSTKFKLDSVPQTNFGNDVGPPGSILSSLTESRVSCLIEPT